LIDFEEEGSVRRFQRMMLKSLSIWWILERRGNFWRILRMRSKCGSAMYGILRSWSTLILSALR
jgi:hypothetical protein